MYAGEVSPSDCFKALEDDLMSVMIDVRTPPEWYFVGQPKVTRMANIAWKVFPNMVVNPDFEQQMRQAGVTEDHKVYFLCKTIGATVFISNLQSNTFCTIWVVKGKLWLFCIRKEVSIHFPNIATI